jgi:N-acetylneuraminic acid mutarotase
MKNLKTAIYFSISLFSIFIFSSCENDGDSDDTVGNWVESSDFEGDKRSNAVSFVIGQIAYVGTGYNGTEDEYYNDFWAYDYNLQFWRRIADFPGAPRTAAVAFSIDGIGYVGTGYDGDDELTDFYSYDPDTDSWTQIADFAGEKRRDATAFAVAGNGYVGTGYDGSSFKDFWQYDPSNDQWEQIPSLGGGKRRRSISFVIGDKAYVGTGDDNGAYEFDFWEFDPSLLPDFPWTKKLDLDDDDDYSIARSEAVAFTVDGLGYVATGSNSSNLSSIWEYNPGSDIWTEMTALEGASRSDAVAFVINNEAFIATGKNGATYFDDLWRFQPLAELDEDD